MQRVIILAYLLICVNCFAQQYPFVHYTPKDGLISNQIRNIYQDSKGRLYFSSLNGLSVYDGSRFINYTSKNGLNFDIVNCVMEMGDDSVWVVTNSPKINCLVRGKMKTLALKGEDIVINNLYRDEKGDLYTAAEQGVYIFEKDRFTRLPFTDTHGADINSLIAQMINVGDHLLIQRDNGLLNDPENPIYLYNKRTKKTTAKYPMILSSSKAPDGRIWVTTKNNIMAVDTAAIQKGKIVLHALPDPFASLRTLGQYFVFFDSGNNCWLGNATDILLKAEPDGAITSFSKSSGLSMMFINFILQDREGITWIATNNGGVNKLVNSNLSLLEMPFSTSPPFGDISYNTANNQLLLYSRHSAMAVFFRNNTPAYYEVKTSDPVDRVIETPSGIFAFGSNNIYKLALKKNMLYDEIIFSDTADIAYGNSIVDINGNLIICGKHINALINGKIVHRKKLNYYADHTASDTNGNVWVATRAGDLYMFEINPNDPSNYLKQKFLFQKEIQGLSPRSLVIDKNDNIWIGTRSHGIHVYYLKDGELLKKFTVTTAAGLSDDFTFQLACDADNTIWAACQAGLDKITIKNHRPVVENITRQNNIYQGVYKVVIDKNNTAWAAVSNGLIRISPENKPPENYSPAVLISMIKAGKDTLEATDDPILTYKQNNLSFYFGATSFMDEKQVLYSYRLLSGSNNQWSEPSANGSVSFIDLHPGDYTLEIKTTFPAGRYPEKTISYSFSIAPPWWQTWWFRAAAALLAIGLLTIVSRIYYRRKLEKKMAVLEKQQAIEKERTRIATDMHDELGAGLSRIKFLSQSLCDKEVNNETVKADLEKITGYSDEMSEKMGEIVWALNEKNDTLADLVAYTRSYAVEYLSSHNIQCKADTPLHLPGTFIPGEIRRNIFLTVKECLHNIVKHANATQVFFSVELNGTMQIIIHDNGKGIDWGNQRAFSNGIQNIKKRMSEIDGKVDFLNEQGTKVKLEIPLAL